MSLLQVVGAVGWGNARLQIPCEADPALSCLILRCWSEPHNRPSFSEILQILRTLREDIFKRPPRVRKAQNSHDEPGTSETDPSVA